MPNHLEPCLLEPVLEKGGAMVAVWFTGLLAVGSKGAWLFGALVCGGATACRRVIDRLAAPWRQHMVSTWSARMERWSDSTMASAHGQRMASTWSAHGQHA